MGKKIVLKQLSCKTVGNENVPVASSWMNKEKKLNSFTVCRDVNWILRQDHSKLRTLEMKNWSEYNIAIISSLGCGYIFHDSFLALASSPCNALRFSVSSNKFRFLLFLILFYYCKQKKSRERGKKHTRNRAASDVKYGFSYYWTLFYGSR